jgi:hypothetical protein
MDVKKMYKRNHAGERPELGNFLTTKRSTVLMTIRATIATTANEPEPTPRLILDNGKRIEPEPTPRLILDNGKRIAPKTTDV